MNLLNGMDIRTLLQSLLDHNVRFLVIGAWALPAYGIERMTKDIDIFIEPTEENAVKTIKALQKIGYGAVENDHVKLFLTQKVLLREYVLQTDIHPFVKGSDFYTAWETKKETDIKGIKVFVPSIDVLIEMKKAANRLKDAEDIINLEKIKSITAEKNKAK